MRFAGSRVQWTAAAVVLLLVLPNLYHSSTTSPLPRGVQVTCDGNTGIDMDSNSCFLWGKDLLGRELQLPTGVEPSDIARLDIERAFFGFIDRCTVTVSFGNPGSGSTSFDQVVPCQKPLLSY